MSFDGICSSCIAVKKFCIAPALKLSMSNDFAHFYAYRETQWQQRTFNKIQFILQMKWFSKATHKHCI